MAAAGLSWGRRDAVLRPVRRRTSAVSRCTGRVVTAASYDFTSAGSQRIPGERKNRTLEKRQVRELDVVVAGLTHMTLKQLAAVAHLLQPIPGVMDDIAIAARLPRSNQARKRQEGLIAKKMRLNIDPEAMQKLSDAVTLAEDSQALYEDSNIQGLVDEWKEGLLGGDQAVFQQVMDTATDLNIELSSQQLGQLVRRLQQCMSDEQQAAELAVVAAASAAPGDSEEEAAAGKDTQALQHSPQATTASAAAADGTSGAQPALSSSSGQGLDSEAGAGREQDPEFQALLDELSEMRPPSRANKRVRSKAKGTGAGKGADTAGRRQATQLASNALCQVLKKVAKRVVMGDVVEKL